MGKRAAGLAQVNLAKITFETTGAASGSWQGVAAIYQGVQIGYLEMERAECDERCGELLRIQVLAQYRRQGVATALWNKAMSLHAHDEDWLRPMHSAHRTDSGDAWARSFSLDLPVRIPVEDEDDY